MRAALAIVLVSACGAVPVAPEAAASELVELRVSRCCSTEPWTYRVLTPAGERECVERAIATEIWECSTSVPRGVGLEIVPPGTGPTWTVSVAADALRVDIRVDQGATGWLRRVWIEVAVDRALAGVILDLEDRRVLNGSALTLVPGAFDLEPMTHLEALGARGWDPVPTHGGVCGTGPDEPLPIEPGHSADLDGARMEGPWISGEAPPGPFRVASWLAVVIEAGRAYEDVRPRVTERYTVSTPLHRLEDYVTTFSAE